MKTVLTLSLVLGAFACSKSAPPPANPATAQPAEHAEHHEMGHEEPADDASKPLVKPGEAKVGDRTECPVSHETFVVGADAEHVEYEGKTYYFCCPGCSGKFGADPAKYTTI